MKRSMKRRFLFQNFKGIGWHDYKSVPLVFFGNNLEDICIFRIFADGIDVGSNTNYTNKTNMIITKAILDELTEQAKRNPRLRQSMDLRNSPEDLSQRMLNALEPGTVMPIHRHKGSSETCVCIRGHFEEYFYDSEGHLTETVDMLPGGTVLNIEASQWHSLRCLESGTILLEAKDGPYRPLDEDEIMSVHGRAL